LLISLFLPWYTVFGAGLAEGPLGDVIEDVGGAVGVDVRDAVTRTGWESFEIADIVCAAAALIALVRAAIAVFGDDDNPAIPGSVLTLALGAAALVLILYRVVNPPGVGQERELGLWIGVLAAGGIVYGSYIAMQAGRIDRPANGPLPG
jgi:hypothetical protein